MTPYFTISADGLDVTDRFAGRHSELTLVDCAGVASDTAEIKIADPRVVVAPPRRGAVLAIGVGYRERHPIAVPKGRFKVDQVSFLGYPHMIKISAVAADNRDALKERRIKNYDNKTFGDIIEEVAGRHGLTPKVASDLAGMRFPVPGRPQDSYEAQHEESDIGFVTRLAGKFGGFATVKQGHLIVARKGDGKSLSGATGIVMITPDRLTGVAECYEVTWKDKPVHGKVEASYFDRRQVKRMPVTEGAGTGVVYRFREPHADETQARKAAQAKVRELQRGEGSARFDIFGDPTVFAEMVAQVSGIRPDVDGAWTITRVEDTINSAGYVTRIEGEIKKGK